MATTNRLINNGKRKIPLSIFQSKTAIVNFNLIKAIISDIAIGDSLSILQQMKTYSKYPDCLSYNQFNRDDIVHQGIFFDDIYVEKSYEDTGFTPDYFRQEIGDKKIYTITSTDFKFLPISKVLFTNNITENNVYEVDTTGMITYGDIYKAAHRYERDGNRYVLADKDTYTKNVKAVIKQYEIFKATNNEFGRIADYSKLITFILRKIESMLTAEERAVLEPFFTRDISGKVEAVCDREEELISIIEEVDSLTIEEL